MAEVEEKWGSAEIIKFLGIYRKYEILWNTNNPNYMRRNAKDEALRKLLQELLGIGYKICSEDFLKKKIKNIKDSYRQEVNKIKKSKKSGAGTDDLYKSKLTWFNEASFLNNILSGRDSSSNLDLSRNLESEDASYSSEPSQNQIINVDLSTESSLTTNNSGQLDKEIPILSNTKPPKKKRKASFQDSISQLKEIANSVEKEDEYERFALHIAAQLRNLPVRSFIIMQEKIQSLITRERLLLLNTQPHERNYFSGSSNSYYDDTPSPSPRQANYIVPESESQQVYIVPESESQQVYIVPESESQQVNYIVPESQSQQVNYIVSESPSQQVNYIVPASQSQHVNYCDTSTSDAMSQPNNTNDYMLQKAIKSINMS